MQNLIFLKNYKLLKLLCAMSERGITHSLLMILHIVYIKYLHVKLEIIEKNRDLNKK